MTPAICPDPEMVGVGGGQREKNSHHLRSCRGAVCSGQSQGSVRAKGDGNDLEDVDQFCRGFHSRGHSATTASGVEEGDRFGDRILDVQSLMGIRVQGR